MGRNKKRKNSNRIRLNKKGDSIQTGKSIRMVVLKDLADQSGGDIHGDFVKQKKSQSINEFIESDVTINNPLVIEHSQNWIQRLIDVFGEKALALSKAIINQGHDAVVTKSAITGETQDIYLFKGQRDLRFKIDG